MGYLPPLTVLQTTREMIGEFGGYNSNLRINDNEFRDMQNMTSAYWPVLAPRAARGRVRSIAEPNGLFAHNDLAWVDGTQFYYGGSAVQGFTLADSPKTFTAMGAYILIWPDKAYYNTSTGEFGSLGNSTASSGTVDITLCRDDGTAYTGYTAAATPPENPVDGTLWIDTHDKPHVLKQFSTLYGTWTSIPTTYVKIAAPGIGVGFSEYDGVTISGMDNPELNGEFVLQGTGDDYVVITGIIDAVATQTAAVTVERRIPDMDYFTESENRVWGCSSANHEIYACAQGDPKNWHRFLGISTDSYSMTVGTPGDFTGACTHLGYVMFFKEDVVHEIYGSKPANYQITNTVCRGVEKGSEKSIIIANETLFYKSAHDVCAYNASLPASISAALGTRKYRNAVAGATASKYYICMEDMEGGHTLFVYDVAHKLWHKEDNKHITGFAALGKELYFIADNVLYSVNGSLDARYADSSAAVESVVEWSAETGDIGMEYPGHKYVSKLQIRLEARLGTLIHIDVQYDGSGVWTEKQLINANAKRSFTVPVIPRRCDTMRIRISGTGDCRIYSITKIIEQGSDL